MQSPILPEGWPWKFLQYTMAILANNYGVPARYHQAFIDTNIDFVLRGSTQAKKPLQLDSILCSN